MKHFVGEIFTWKKDTSILTSMNMRMPTLTLTNTRMAMPDTLTNTGMNTNMLTPTGMIIQRDSKVILMRASMETTIMSTRFMRTARMNTPTAISRFPSGKAPFPDGH